ncbi:bifunctional protein FolD 1, mitochondrial-like [Cynara cardunculus var. scolymus]|uniref:bifunctional protein FolD 1, mitochondrial-like n=1 Tax=Cynara cardunculus var. scolymus TaxID=59895 RepID=UPI000D6284A6|nr:bifunctional protein FolD 1, mitochondrial-like [Cynara cardunculus var. scolymus]
MALKNKVQSILIPWWRKNTLLSSTSRTLNTFATGSDNRIIKSPSLVSLDLPDEWTSSSTNCNAPSTNKLASEETGRVIDGKQIAEEIISGVACEVERMKKTIGEVPGVAVILVGERRDSQTYVRNKIKACEEAGIKFSLTEFSEKCSEDEVCDAIMGFNMDPSFHGILVQLPLPQRLNEEKVLDVMRLEKDVDGFHPMNMGNLAMRGREPLFIPCTPKGCVELLIRSGVEIMGKKAVVIGRSNIVGLPASLLLQRHHATVTVVDALTSNPEEITREADILVSAVGVPNLVRGSWLKPGAVVVDVGTYPVEDDSCEQGYRLIGDVCYEEASRVASWLTPVPGGVGPMTVAMLLYNTLESARRIYKFV